MNQPPPPPSRLPPDEHRRSAAPALGFLMAIAGWLLGVVCVVSAADADDPTTRYFLGVVLAIIGTGSAIVATLYDVAGRDR